MDIIMDPFTAELLSAPTLPGAFLGSGQATEFDDAYLRAIGALPPRRPRAPASVDYPDTLLPSSAMLPSSCTAAHVIQPAVELSRKRAAPEPVTDAAALKKNPAKRPRTRCPYLPDYDADIDFNLRDKERNATQRPSPDYLNTAQGGPMCERTHADLVVWMDDLARHHRLAPGTLHRAVSYVDRVLSSARPLSSTSLRLVGATAVFTAAKYEDRSAVLRLNAADVARYCGFNTTGKEVTEVEREMLATLRYELGGPTAHTFVDHFTRNSRGERNMEIRRVAHRLADTSLLDYGCLRFMPSAVAATALFLAMLIVHPAGSQEFFEDLTGYKPKDLVEGMQSLLRTNPDSRSVILPVLRQYL